MNEIHLQNVDLNLLVVLDALLEHHSVTRAAESLGKTQSSVSHALGRLRDTFDDPLLVRVGNEMRPTDHAMRLAPPLRALMADARKLVFRASEFDPASYDRLFRVLTTDFGEVAIIPPILEELRRVAPNVRLTVMNAFDETDRLVREGSADMALGTNFRDLAGMRITKLFDEHFVCVIREDHPLAEVEMSVDDYVAFDHLLVTPRGLPGSIADTILADAGRSRRVVLRTPHFLSAGFMTAQTDCILTIPSRVANVLEEHFELVSRACPLAMPVFRFSMVFSEIFHEDEGHAWFREFISTRLGGSQ